MTHDHVDPAPPLAGRRVVVTRAADVAGELRQALVDAGAGVVEVPTIATVDPADGGAALRAAVGDLAAFAWIVLTSPTGARRLAAAMAAHDPPIDVAGAPPVACVGPSTAAAARRAGLTVGLVAGIHVGEGLVADFPVAPAPDPASGPARVLLAQAGGARPVVADGLAAKGWAVGVAEAYRSEPRPAPPEVVALARGCDAITFTSSSTVSAYLAAAGPAGLPPVVVCIGPVTADTARAAGVRVDAVAEPSTIPGLVAAVVAVLAPERAA